MWTRMLELLYTPFVLLLISYDSSKNNSLILRSRHDSPAVVNVVVKTNDSDCPKWNEKSVLNLIYNHPNPQLKGCYPEAETGPCKENMKLYRIDETRYGECDCDVSSARVLLYHNETNRCYPVFQQGYCPIGEQLVTTRDNPLVPVCRRTVCYEALTNPANKGEDFVPFRNSTGMTCAKVGSRCNATHIIGFEKPTGANPVYKVTPTCIRPRNLIRTIGAPPIRCSPGTYRAISGHCQPPVWDWD